MTLKKKLATVGIVRDKAQTAQTGSLKTAHVWQFDVPGKSDWLGVEWSHIKRSQRTQSH
jgi:hypothetical protein